MTDEVRLGRRWAHGRRVVRVAQRRDVSAVLLEAGDAACVARGLLRRALSATGALGVRVRPEESHVAQALARAGVLRLEERVEGTAAAPRWVPWRVTVAPDASTEVSEALGRLDPQRERVALVGDLDGARIVAADVESLRALPPDAPLAPPPESLLAGTAWTVYAAALRAASIWERLVEQGERPSARELAARALGSSKAWTAARRDAFEVVVGRPFHEAVSTMEQLVRLRGPLRWRLGDVEGDARSARPWIGLPAAAIREATITACDAAGVLVVENLETFEELSRRTDVDQRWLCVFGDGYVGHGQVALLRRLAAPVAAWCDLDPDGIHIVADLARRLDRPVTPVGMDPDLLDSPYARPASPRQLAEAAPLVAEGPPLLRPLARAILATRCVCEQEPLHAAVLGDLDRRLRW